MKPEMLLEHLETTAETLSVKVSYENLASSFEFRGGLCRVKGAYRVIIDKRATAQERVATLASALSTVATPEQVNAAPPKVRDALIFYSTSTARSPDGSRKAS